MNKKGLETIETVMAHTEGNWNVTQHVLISLSTKDGEQPEASVVKKELVDIGKALEDRGLEVEKVGDYYLKVREADEEAEALLSELKSAERDLRLGHLPEDVAESLDARADEILQELEDKPARYLRIGEHLRAHMCEFVDDYCIFCGLDGRA